MLAAVVVARLLAAGVARADGASDALFSRYVDNPAANLGAMKALGRGPVDVFPSGVALLLGDAFLRTGDNASAARIFSLVLARHEGQPIEGIASIGLGWATFAQGELAAARLLFESGLAQTESVQESDPRSRALVGVNQVSQLAIGLLDAYQGQGAAAELRLDQLAVSPATDFSLRPVARLGAAYARYWAGDYAGAAASFDVVALEFPDAPTADDGRYGAAWSRWRGGDRASALDDLETLARERPRGGRARISRELVDLDRREIVLRGLRGDRRPVGSPVQRVAGALDLDGVRLARAALHLIREDDADDDEADGDAAVGVQIAARRRPGGGSPGARVRSQNAVAEPARVEGNAAVVEAGLPPLRVAALVGDEQGKARAPRAAVGQPDERGASGGWVPLWVAAALAATALGIAAALRRRVRR